MDDIDDEGGELFINFTFDVKLIRVVYNVLVPSDFSVTCSIERLDNATDAEVELALTKWRYWIDHVVKNSVAFDSSNDAAVAILLDDTGIKRIGNTLMMTPDDPSDEVLGALFQSKMNALSDGKVICVAIEVRSDNLHGLSFTLVGDHAGYLPATTAEWLGSESYFPTPWWTRNDASCIDVLVPEDAMRETHPAWARSLDFLDRSRDSQEHAKVTSTRSGFRPTIIDGGKGDDDE